MSSARYRFPPAIISHAVRLYDRFTLSSATASFQMTEIRDELFGIVRRLRLGCAALLRTVTLCNVYD
jgi:hypothetical protein